MRHIRLHERVNDLPDANYATLKYFLGHLHKYGCFSYIIFKYTHLSARISRHEAENQMSISNLAIVFGPTLFGIGGGGAGVGAVNGMADATWQNKVYVQLLIPRNKVTDKAINYRPSKLFWSIMRIFSSTSHNGGLLRSFYYHSYLFKLASVFRFGTTRNIISPYLIPFASICHCFHNFAMSSSPAQTCIPPTEDVCPLNNLAKICLSKISLFPVQKPV
jgi:RhoGAP domain